MHSKISHDRSGYTLIEMFVAIFILCIISAFVLPGIQQSRESARRTECANNLRQMAIALQEYESINNYLPSLGGNTSAYIPFQKQYSVHSQLLLFLENAQIYNGINFSVEHHDAYLFNGNFDTNANASVYNISIRSFVCPSDTVNLSAPGTNYRFNVGTERWVVVGGNPSCGPIAGYVKGSTLSLVTDGLSNTIVLSEKLRSSNTNHYYNYRNDIKLGYIIGLPGTVEENYDSCINQSSIGSTLYTKSGLSWLTSSLSHSLYNHVIEPNSIMGDCGTVADPMIGLMGARSNHYSGVMTAFLDGSVKFLKNSVNRSTWKSIGTAAGGEVIPDFPL